MTRPSVHPRDPIPASGPTGLSAGERAAGAAAPAETALVDGVDVDAVAAAAGGCPGVAGLFAGRYGEFGSYLPGRRVAGVEVRDRTVTVHVRSRWGVPARHLLAEITAAIAPLTADRPVRVVVADIDDPPGATGAEPGTALGSAPPSPPPT